MLAITTFKDVSCNSRWFFLVGIAFLSILMEKVIDSIYDIFTKFEKKSTNFFKSLHCQIVT